MRKIKGLRWYMIALVTLGTVLGCLTRNAVAACSSNSDGRVQHFHPTVFLSSQPILLLIRSCNR